MGKRVRYDRDGLSVMLFCDQSGFGAIQIFLNSNILNTDVVLLSGVGFNPVTVHQVA